MSADPNEVKHMSEADVLILVDEQDNEPGSCEKVDCHLGAGKLHRAFSVFLFNPDEFNLGRSCQTKFKIQKRFDLGAVYFTGVIRHLLSFFLPLLSILFSLSFAFCIL